MRHRDYTCRCPQCEGEPPPSAGTQYEEPLPLTYEPAVRHGMDVGVVEWQRDTGQCTEDGEPIVVSDWLVQVTAPSGRRWQHIHTFAGEVNWSRDEHFGWLPCARHGNREAAEALAARVQNRLDRGGRLNVALWREIDPRYGSPAYEQLDRAGHFRDRERREAEEVGA